MDQKTPSQRPPGWLKQAMGFDKVAQGQPGTRQHGQGGATVPGREPARKKLSKEEIEQKEMQAQATAAQTNRQLRDHQARVFLLMREQALDGVNMEDPEIFAGSLVAANAAATTPGMQHVDANYLADMGFAPRGVLSKEQFEDPRGFFQKAFMPAGSGEGTALDKHMARQQLNAFTNREDDMISMDPKRIAARKEIDQHNFFENGGAGVIPRDLDNARWTSRDGVDQAMIDYDGVQYQGEPGYQSGISPWESLKMDLGFKANGPYGQAEILHRRAQDDLKMMNWNGYKDKMDQAWGLVGGDEFKGTKIHDWLGKEIENMPKTKVEYQGKYMARKFSGAQEKDYTLPKGYELPPRPPEDIYPEAAKRWDITEAANRNGAQIPFFWDQDNDGPTPTPIKENWVRFDAPSTDPETGKTVWNGERRPEHQAILDREAAKAQKERASNGQQAYDDKAVKYKNEMVDKRRELLASYYQSNDPEEQAAILEESKRLNEEYKDGAMPAEYAKADDGDHNLVTEWDAKTHKANMGWAQAYGEHARSVSGGPGSQAVAYPGTAKEYLAKTLGEEPPEVAEARKRIAERKANDNTLDAVIDRSRKFFDEEKTKTQEYEDALMKSQIESGNATSPVYAKASVHESGREFQKQIRQLRVRGQRAAAAGNFEEAAELMARQNLMSNMAVESAQSGKVSPEEISKSFLDIGDDNRWQHFGPALLDNPENKDLRDSYTKEFQENQEDFTAFHSSDPGEKLKALKARTARFDKGRAQELGIQVDKDGNQIPAGGVKPVEEQKPLPPIGPQPKPGEEPKPTEQPLPGTPAEGQPPGEPPSIEPIPGAPADPNAVPGAATPATPPAPAAPPTPAPATGGPVTATPPQEPAEKPSVMPERLRAPGNRPKHPLGGSREREQAAATTPTTLMPRSRQPQTATSDATAAGAAGGPAAVPAPTAAPTPTQQGVQQVMKTVGAAPASAPGGTQIAPSNTDQAGLKSPPVAQVGLNKKQVGNPGQFNGVGTNRVTPGGATPGQASNFTALNNPKTLSTNLFKLKGAIPGGRQVQAGLKLADFRSTPKLASFKGGYLKKDAGFNHNRRISFIDKIPIIGKPMMNMALAAEDAHSYAGSGRWGRSLQSSAGVAGNGALIVGSVYGAGGLARLGAGAVATGGRALLGRGAAGLAARETVKGAVPGAARATGGYLRNFGSLRGATGNLKPVGKLGLKVGIPVTGAVAGDSGLIKNLGSAKINQQGVNTSLKSLMPVRYGNGGYQPTPTPKNSRILG